MVRLFNPNFVMKDWLMGEQSKLTTVVNKDQGVSIFDDMLVFIFILLVGVCVMILLVFLRVCIKDKI